MKEPKQKPTDKPVRTADKARLPRTAMRAVWLRTREGTRRLVAEEHRDGQYQEAAAQEEHAVEVVGSVAEAAAGATLRGGKKLAQQAAQKRQSEKAAGQAEQTAEPAMGTATRPTTAEPGNPDSRNATASPYYNRQNKQSHPLRKPSTSPTMQMPAHQMQPTEAVDLRQSRLRQDSLARFQGTTRRKAQLRSAPLPKMASSAASPTAAQTKTAQIVQHAKQAARAAKKTAQEAVKRVVNMVMAGLKALWAATHTMLAAIAAARRRAGVPCRTGLVPGRSGAQFRSGCTARRPAAARFERR